MTVVLAHGGLPACAPRRSAGRQQHLVDRTSSRRARQDERTADEPKFGMVIVIRIELVDRAFAGRPGTDERVDLDVFVEINSRPTAHLVGIVLPNDTLTRPRVIRCAN